MLNNINNDYVAIPYFVINNLKNIVSYNLKAPDNINLLLRKIPQIGQSFVDIFPQEQTSYVSEIVTNLSSINQKAAI